MLRSFRLPADLSLMIQILPKAFQYPDHPEWSIQTDELESILKLVGTARRLWPLFFVLSKTSPQMQDFLRGFIWEEDGQPVGLVNVSRIGTSNDWMIANVAVLPAYRGRGIARKLVAAAVELAEARKAQRVILDVVKGNTPAVQLYSSMDFALFATAAVLRRPAVGRVDAQPNPPTGYKVERVPPYRWQPFYTLSLETTPSEVREYRPVTVEHFRISPGLQMISALFGSLSGMHEQGLVIQQQVTGTSSGNPQVVAAAGLSLQTRGGMNTARFILDEKEHGELAPYLVGQALHAIGQRSPRSRIECQIPNWQPRLIEATEASGFQVDFEMQSMGLRVDSHQ
jgi:ribosomal protein S18 acetylase RimI-like enzyme